MRISCVTFLLTVIKLTQQDEYLWETTTESKLAESEKQMSEYVLDVLKHFQKPDPIGIPGADIPDPLAVPDIRKHLGLHTWHFQNTKIYGLSKFRITRVNAEIESMRITANMSLDSLEAKGNSKATSFFTENRSPFSLNVTGINITALASIVVSRDGKLTAGDIDMEIYFQTISMHFDDAGALGFIISSIINTAGSFIFDSIKPHLLKEAYTKAKDEINKKLVEVAGDLEFPNSISPLDMIIIDLRKKVREMKLDPYKIDDYDTTMGLLSIALNNTWIKGISSFQRDGNISLTLVNNTVFADFEIGTRELQGTTQWEISMMNGIWTKAGTVCFTIEYISGRIVLSQPADTRNKPQFKDLILDMGNIQLRSDGAGTIDYILEFAVNIFPNLLRYQILKVLEGPIKWKIQQELNEINVEETIKEQLPKIDEMLNSGLKLSQLRAIKEEQPVQEEFFDF